MATDTRALSQNTPDDASFRAYVAGVIAHFIAAGLVQTNDTGQINPVSAVRPVAINTVAGYAIFRFNDALQATHPIHLKVEFKSGSTVSSTGFQVSIALGGTNGAGGLLGFSSSPRTLIGNNNQVTNTALAATRDGSTFVHTFPANVPSSTSSHFLVVERLRDADDAPTAEGVIFFAMASGSGALSGGIYTHEGGFASVIGAALTPDLGASASTSGGEDVAVFPALFAFNGKWRHGSLMNYKNGDLPFLVPTVLTNHDGTPHSFMPLDASGPQTSGVNTKLAFVYE